MARIGGPAVADQSDRADRRAFMSDARPTVGFIGTGVMGASMAGHLLNAGYPMQVYTRTRAKAEDLLQRGASWKNSPGELARGCDVIIIIVGFPQDVEEVYFDEEGIFSTLRPGTTVIDMTTTSPALAERIDEAACERGAFALDAPVSGGDRGAREATLSIMVGGDEAVFNAVRPIFEILGENIVHQGPAGAGQHTKLCNQMAIAAGMLGVCEALAYAERAGLDPETVLQSIGSGAAASWSLSNLGPRMIARDFRPGFFVRHFVKDMTLALESSRELGLDTPGLELALEMYRRLLDEGGGALGTQALFKLYEPDGGA
jgi:3-hydroxyisobutyrate dehydrogenase